MRSLAVPLALLVLCSGGRASHAANAKPAPKSAVDEELDSLDENVGSTNDPKFQEKLTVMLKRAEQSIKLLRIQITQNQSAPFLANLYMQLGDLLSQKSNVLYYLQMEHDKNTDLKVTETKKFSPVVATEQEAIGIYQQLVKEFPTFDKLDKVMYRLAVAQKAIDETAGFVDTSEKLIAQFPDTKEAIQARLLLGQYFYDQQDYESALKHLNAVKDSPHPFERNAARYRIGLIEILQEKHISALAHFEQVATDAELKEDDNPMAIDLKTKTAKNNIKREALIDSVRAYTQVYPKGGDPVAFYSRIAPTEVLFQETIEKLAYRYIFLKKYNFAIKLLRTLSERTADAQKIMNIYHEVLQMIPIKDRIDLPVQEIQFVLEKYNYWFTHYTLTPELKLKSFQFFETQVRELGTHSHDLAKTEHDPKTRKDRFERAGRYYLLYLGFFHKDTRSVKIATNLADVYFNQGNYLESASYYLRVFSGEFGPPPQKEILIQNAILALQKPSDYGFYEQLRSKGLLVKAIRAYQAFKPKKKNDPDLVFTLAKTYYEQGFYDHALEDLYQFMKRYPEGREVPSAVELILNYFNTRSDFKSIVDWSDKMLALKPRNAELRTRLQSVRSKALLKRLDEQVKTQKGYDQFAQGKSYLQTALSAGDAKLRSAAFEQALGRSRAEKDIETFLKTAFVMAKAETNPQKRADLLNSMADETLAITRFNMTENIWRKILEDGKVPGPARTQAFEKMTKLSVMMHDLPQVTAMMASSYASTLTPDTRKAIKQQLTGVLESAISMPAKSLQSLLAQAQSDEEWLELFKAQTKMPENLRRDLLAKVAARCHKGQGSALCKWSTWPQSAGHIAQFVAGTRTAPTTIASVEPVAGKMNAVLEELKFSSGSGEPQLDILIALGSGDVYQGFATYLNRTADANKQIAAILKSKANESMNSAKSSRAQCQKVIATANLISPTNQACSSGRLPTLSDALRWRKPLPLASTNADPKGSDILEQQKALFLNHKDWKLYFDVSELYLNKHMWNHAAATATFATSTFPQNQEEFDAILGCALMNMGLMSEAQFHLAKASELNGHKEECLRQIRAQARAN